MTWISVKEQLPPLQHKILFLWICPGTNRNISMGYLCKNGWDIYLPYDSFKMSNEYFTVTHWMELPEYPSIEQSDLPTAGTDE